MDMRGNATGPPTRKPEHLNRENPAVRSLGQAPRRHVLSPRPSVARFDPAYQTWTNTDCLKLGGMPVLHMQLAQPDDDADEM